MTEKRFILKYIEEQHLSANLYDDKTFIGSIGIGAELIVELLNSFNEENKQLEQENEEFNEELMEYDSFKRLYEEKIEKLKKENEQLKANYNSLSHNNGLLYDECTDKINVLKKENEQLEKGNKQLLCTIIEILDFIEDKKEVSIEEMGRWWKEKEKELMIND